MRNEIIKQSISLVFFRYQYSAFVIKTVVLVYYHRYTPTKQIILGGILESACLPFHPCVHVSVYKILVSVKALAGVLTLSHTMTPFDAPGKQAF